VLGWAAAAVGVTGIVSALTPEFANRSDFVRGVLPPGVPGAARIAALTFGLTLIWLSRSLAGRRRRAWQLGIVLVIGLTVAHLAKGLDFEEATFGLLVLAALYRFRKRFDVPGDPASVRLDSAEPSDQAGLRAVRGNELELGSGSYSLSCTVET